MTLERTHEQARELRRRPDWRVRLVAYLASVARRDFRPGRHDCALFAAGAVDAQTGTDLARGWRGYRTLAEGRRRLAAAGYADHVALVAALLPEVPVAFGRVGDIGVCDAPVPGVGEATGPADPPRRALGVVQGRGILVLRAQGIGVVPLTSALRMFRVG